MMKIQAAKQDLEAAINLASASLGSAADLSAHFLFRFPSGGDGKRAEVLTYNGQTFSCCPFIAVVECQGSEAFTVEGKRLQEWMRAVPDAALILEFDAGVVKATDPERGTQEYTSLDPSGYPFWDNVYQGAKVTAKLPADRLHAAIDYVIKFTVPPKEESVTPALRVCEVRNGVLTATDKNIAAMVTVEGMTESNLRIHARDAGGILSFLSAIKGDVEVLEQDRHAFFRRADGAVYGETRYSESFPAFGRPSVTDQYTWTLDLTDLDKALHWLASGAPADEDRLRFVRADANGPVMVSMLATTGRQVKTPVKVKAAEVATGAPPLPADGFVLSHPRLKRLLDAHAGEETFRIGLNVSKKGGGYARSVERKFANEKGEGGDEYWAVLVWVLR